MTLVESWKRINSEELEVWQAEHSIEPFGDDWLQAGTVACASSFGKNRPSDFIPYSRKRQTPEEMQRIVADSMPKNRKLDK